MEENIDTTHGIPGIEKYIIVTATLKPSQRIIGNQYMITHFGKQKTVGTPKVRWACARFSEISTSCNMDELLSLEIAIGESSLPQLKPFFNALMNFEENNN